MGKENVLLTQLQSQIILGAGHKVKKCATETITAIKKTLNKTVDMLRY